MPRKAKTALWANDNGMIACSDHLGRQGEWALEERPTAKTLKTTLDRWERVEESDKGEPWAECVRCKCRLDSDGENEIDNRTHSTGQPFEGHPDTAAGPCECDQCEAFWIAEGDKIEIEG